MNVLGVDPIFYFQVKFYPPEPILLQEDITRLVWFFYHFGVEKSCQYIDFHSFAKAEK